MSRLLDVVVPVRWSGTPFADGSTPLAWLGADGLELPGTGTPEPPQGAMRLQFRTGATMRERMEFERAIDDVNGGPENTHDIDMTIGLLMRDLEIRYSDRIWPDGRPETDSPDELAAQTARINLELQQDLSRPPNGDEEDEDAERRRAAVMYDRVSRMRDQARTLAEMVVRHQRADGEDGLLDREWESPEHIDAAVAAYRAAKSAREQARGNASRSAA